MRISVVPDAIGRASATVAGLALGAIFVTNVTQVLLRTLGAGWVWVGDLSRLLMLWAVMMGAAAAYCRHEHIVGGFLPKKWENGFVLRLIVRVIEVAFLLLLLLAGVRVTLARANIELVQLGVSSGLAYLAIPVAAALMLVASFALPLRHPVAHNEAEALAAEPHDDNDYPKQEQIWTR